MQILRRVAPWPTKKHTYRRTKHPLAHSFLSALTHFVTLSFVNPSATSFNFKNFWLSAVWLILIEFHTLRLRWVLHMHSCICIKFFLVGREDSCKAEVYSFKFISTKQTWNTLQPTVSATLRAANTIDSTRHPFSRPNFFRSRTFAIIALPVHRTFCLIEVLECKSWERRLLTPIFMATYIMQKWQLQPHYWWPITKQPI